MDNKTRRFYKVGEMVWVISKKTEGKVKSINKVKTEVVVIILEGIELVEYTLKMWEIDKLKYKAKEEFSKFSKVNKPTVYFAKVRPDAVIPSKREEDAGYDVYANLLPEIIEGVEVCEIFVPAFKTTLIPTGIACALPNTHYLNLKHERGSTSGSKNGSEFSTSMSVLAGVVDSGYRGEIFIALTPLHKDVLITSEVTEVIVHDNAILYPYSKAICQATIDLVPQVNIEEISFEKLATIESERGATKLGESGK